MLSKNFRKLCSLIDLSERSFELSEGFFSDFRKKHGLYPTHAFLEIYNDGKCSAENIILYVEGNDKVQFITDDELYKIRIALYNQLPEHISKIIVMAKEIEKGTDQPIVTMYERKFGKKRSYFERPIRFNRSLYGVVHQEKAKFSDQGIEFSSENGLMHNHPMTVPCKNIFLCPFLEKDEEISIKYTFHAKNLPDPQKGRLRIRGG